MLNKNMFRFGVLMSAVESRHQSAVRSPTEFRQRVRRLEGLGFDVLSMPDHLGSVAPFPALMAAADVTTTLKLGTCVLNAAFYEPALLSRDAAEVNLLSGGRLELGVGAGYVQAEFEGLGMKFDPGGRTRLDRLEHLTTYLSKQLPEVPLMIAGNGIRLLTLAAHRADIVGLTGQPAATATADPLAERVGKLRSAAGPRVSEIEINLLVAGVPIDATGLPDLRLARRRLPNCSDSTLSDLPGVFHGSPPDIADTLRKYRAKYGISYFTVMDFHADHFAQVIAHLR